MNGLINDNFFSALPNGFEQLYIDLRIHEKRMYTDEEVARLPNVSEEHVHKNEWKIRKASSRRLTKYLRNKKKALKILEVGCGNGWLSHQFSKIPASKVVGLDINLYELEQADRVFAGIPNLHFIYGHLNELKNQKFDVIVFAASIQYFRSFSDIMELALDRLNQQGEIHIIDSHFYFQAEVQVARRRSCEYFNRNGFNKMDRFYFHHTLKELDEFNGEILFNPNSMVHRILRKKSPFYWVCIKK